MEWKYSYDLLSSLYTPSLPHLERRRAPLSCSLCQSTRWCLSQNLAKSVRQLLLRKNRISVGYCIHTSGSPLLTMLRNTSGGAREKHIPKRLCVGPCTTRTSVLVPNVTIDTGWKAGEKLLGTQAPSGNSWLVKFTVRGKLLLG